MRFNTLLGQAVPQAPSGIFVALPIALLGLVFFFFLRAYKSKRGEYEALVVPLLRACGILMAAMAALSSIAAVMSLVFGEAPEALFCFAASVSSLVTWLLLFGLAQLIEGVERFSQSAKESAQAAQTNAKLLRQLLRAYGHEPEA